MGKPHFILGRVRAWKAEASDEMPPRAGAWTQCSVCHPGEGGTHLDQASHRSSLWVLRLGQVRQGGKVASRVMVGLWEIGVQT